jgi:hypothetical protein
MKIVDYESEDWLITSLILQATIIAGIGIAIGINLILKLSCK